MANGPVYSPAEICEMFGISKSTLFRWERDGLLPPVHRDLANQRQYTRAHLQAISELQKGKLGQQFERVAAAEDLEQQEAVLKAVSLHKVLEGDMTGLYELAEYARPSPETVRQLLRIALDQYEPHSDEFRELVETVLKQSKKLSSHQAARGGGGDDRTLDSA